ncbi:LOW QUALITY PROTEIN: A-kinase anchor protein 3 [Podargus strigoides]
MSDNIDWQQSQRLCKVDCCVLGEVSLYADSSNLVIAMTHKEINEKSDGPDPCFAVLGKPGHKSVGLVVVISVIKTMEGQANDSSIACIVLNLLLKHSKAMASDLIDFCMKNFHDVAGKLLTDSDFASSVKLTACTLGSHKAAEIAWAMLNHLHSALIVQKPGGDSLAYASVKTGSGTDARAQMRFAATRTETLPKEKEITWADAVGNHIIKQGFALWHEKGDSSSAQFTGSLVDTVLKLCLVTVKYSSSESPLAEQGSREDGTGSGGSKGMGTADSMAGQLQELSSVAVEKGSKVGEILQAVLQYKKERQSGEALGNSLQFPLLNWLLNASLLTAFLPKFECVCTSGICGMTPSWEADFSDWRLLPLETLPSASFQMDKHYLQFRGFVSRCRTRFVFRLLMEHVADNAETCKHSWCFSFESTCLVFNTVNTFRDKNKTELSSVP